MYQTVPRNVKDWVGRSGNVPLPVVNNKIEEYITAQQQEFEISIYANGPYDLADTHGYLRNERHIWNGMNVEERKVASLSKSSDTGIFKLSFSYGILSFERTSLELLSPVSTVENKLLALLLAAAWSLPCSVLFSLPWTVDFQKLLSATLRLHNFHSWFVENESRLFKSHFIKEITNQANVEGHFYNNRVESTNDNVKDWVGRSGNVPR
jgi:hypothetical protein